MTDRHKAAGTAAARRRAGISAVAATRRATGLPVDVAVRVSLTDADQAMINRRVAARDAALSRALVGCVSETAQVRVKRWVGDGRADAFNLARMVERGGTLSATAAISVRRSDGRGPSRMVGGDALRAGVVDGVAYLLARKVISPVMAEAARRIERDREAAGLRMRIGAGVWGRLVGGGCMAGGADGSAAAALDRMAAASARLRSVWSGMPARSRAVVWEVVVDGETLGESGMRLVQRLAGDGRGGGVGQSERSAYRLARKALRSGLQAAAVRYGLTDVADAE